MRFFSKKTKPANELSECIPVIPTLKVKILSERAVMPSYAKPGDAGLDLTVTSREVIDYYPGFDLKPKQMRLGFGIAIELPPGYVGLLFPRSSVYKTDLRLSNCVGIIDSGYRGEIQAVFDVSGQGDSYYIGERAVQLVILRLPSLDIIQTDALSDSNRGVQGYGSSGK